jgi:hypothetical protein
MARVAFHNTGPNQLPGLIVMSISDKVLGEDLDRDRESIIVLINANDEAQSFTMSDLAGSELFLHEVQLASVDPIVKNSAFNGDTGTFEIPARTTAVFVEFAPVEERIGNLIDDVQSLVDDGVLNKGQGNALIAKLKAAIEKVIVDQGDVAVNQLEAFINQVEAFIRGGTLAAEQGQYLIDQARSIIMQIEG